MKKNVETTSHPERKGEKAMPIRFGEVAEEDAASKAYEAHRLLSRYRDVICTWAGQDSRARIITEEIIRREYKRVKGAYLTRALEERRERKISMPGTEFIKESTKNDQMNNTPGCTVYFKKKPQRKYWLSVSRELESWEEAVTWTPMPEGILKVDLPNGAFRASFFRTMEIDKVMSKDPKEGETIRGNTFEFDLDEIVRVEGYGGEVWQNVNYDWDGSNKSKWK